MLDFFLSPFQFNLEELEAGLSEINANNDKLQHFYNKLVEYKLLFDKSEVLPLNRVRQNHSNWVKTPSRLFLCRKYEICDCFTSSSCVFCK
ncbi:hypothetical protein YC2023_044966 [Brassica napus]